MRQAEWGCIDWGWLCTHPRAAARAAPSTAVAVCIRLALLALWPSCVGSHSTVPLLGSREAQSPFPCIRYSHYKLISRVIVWRSLIGDPSPVTPLTYDVTVWPLLEHPDLVDLHTRYGRL